MEGLVEPVVAGGGLAVVLHAVEDAFDHVPPLVRLLVVVPRGRTVPLGRHDRRQAERLGRQPGGIPLVRAVHEQVRAHEPRRARPSSGARGPRRARCPGSDGSRRPCPRCRMPRELWRSALPGRRRRTVSPLFRRPSRVLVDLHARGAHGEHPDPHPDDQLLPQCREQALYRAVPGPAVEPLVDGDPLAVALRLIPPRGSRAAHPQQDVDERVVVNRHVAALARQQMRDPHELVKRDVIPRRTHTTIITQNLNSVNTP